MFSIRLLTRPSVLAPSLAAAAAICGLAVWHAHATAPVPEAPSISMSSESPATDWSVRLTSSEDKAPASSAFALQLANATAPSEEDGSSWGYREFAHDDRFPVVSSDGTIAMLFEDSEDFTGAPITTLVAWSKSGARVASFAIGGHVWNGNEVDVLAEANAWLARSTWQPLKAEATMAWNDDDSVQTVKVASGAPLVFDANTGTLTRNGRTVRAAFGWPGTRFLDEDGTTSHASSCGSITGIQRAFGSGHLLVLVPSMNLGGDSCFGSPSADVATAIALR